MESGMVIGAMVEDVSKRKDVIGGIGRLGFGGKDGAWSQQYIVTQVAGIISGEDGGGRESEK